MKRYSRDSPVFENDNLKALHFSIAGIQTNPCLCIEEEKVIFYRILYAKN